MDNKILIKKINKWMNNHDYSLRNQEDLVESRTNWESLKYSTLDAYYLLLTIKNELENNSSFL